MGDIFRPVPPPAEDVGRPPLLRRLFWFAMIALVSVAVVAASAYILKAALRP